VHASSTQDWLELVRARVAEAVRKRLVADVPVGALLSGGIDSSIVVALMAEASTEPVRTFTVGFPDARYDERQYARAVAQRYGTRHEEVVLDVDVEATLPRLLDSFDEPLGDEAILPLYLICEEAQKHVTVALVGDGGDESFGGYERYYAHGLATHVPSSVAHAASSALRAFPHADGRSMAHRAERFLAAAATTPTERYGRLVEVFPPEMRIELWDDEALIELGRLRSTSLFVGTGEGVTELQRLDLESYLPGDLLPKADIASMAHSLELRSPLLDHEVVELGLALPDELKWRRGKGKVALRRAFADRFPPAVAGRGKVGFGVPVARWLRVELRELAHGVLLGPELQLFRRATVERLLREHERERVDHSHRLWCLLMLELWYRRWVQAGSRSRSSVHAGLHVCEHHSPDTV
jgi:asparagine synthase (glutamine-hydrolysing)